MSRGIPSLKYLAMLSGALIAIDEKALHLAAQGLGDKDIAEALKSDWSEIMELAKEIHGLVVVKKPAKRSLKNLPDNPVPGVPPGTE